jgi:hypothetical protein
MATKERSAHFKQVVDLAADAFVETVVASFSYAIEIRAQIKEDLEELRSFWQREEDDDDDDDEASR